MKSYDYVIVDVFTRYQLSGNPLAIVMKADGLSDARMQAIAAEFGLSETVFVNQPRLDVHTAALRIFTPTHEMPFAGHPTVGAAVYLGLRQRLQGVRLEENIGVITCVMEQIDRNSATAHFSLPMLPQEEGTPPPVDTIAAVLGISPADIGFKDMMPARYSAGVPYVLVPVADASVLSRIQVERRGWAAAFGSDAQGVYVFAETPEEQENDYAARMFSPELTSGEDPATGSAAAALIGLLATHCGIADGKPAYHVRQGQEMGRPGRITMRFTMQGGELVRAGIGGDAVLVGKGVLDLAD